MEGGNWRAQGRTDITPHHRLAELADEFLTGCRGDGPSNCVARCPLRVDAHGYMQLTRLGRFREALQLIREELPFPGILGHVCVHPCERHCKRIDTDSAIRIRDVKRFLARWEPGEPQHVVDCLPLKEPTVAVVGAGPAGLIAGYDLRRRGYRVTVFEKEDRIGGCLTHKIPEWRLPAAVRERDLSITEAVGLTIETGVEVGREVELSDLCASHHAVLLLVGFGGGQVLLDRESSGLGRSARHTIRVDPLTGMSDIDGVFAGADAVSGPGTVIHALAWGRRLAESADRFLEGRDLAEDRESHRPPPLLWQLEVDEVERRRRERSPVLLRRPPEPMSEDEAVEEGERCLDCVCGLCTAECEFLAKHCDVPRQLAAKVHDGPAPHLDMVYSCNLCGLCREVCPVDLDTGELLLEARRNAVRAGIGPLDRHRKELRFYRLGVSKSFSLAACEPGRRTAKKLFFTGCSLPASSPHNTARVYQELRRLSPGIGVLMHCCGAPAEALGMEEDARSARREVERMATGLGADELIVACPNCQRMFDRPDFGLRVRSVWQLLAEAWSPEVERHGLDVSVHDPCVARYDTATQTAVRKLIADTGAGTVELEASGAATRCCGLGGRISGVDPELARAVARRRTTESTHPIITYCTRCRSALYGGGGAPVHLLELLFTDDLDVALARKPFGAVRRYANRLLAKRSLRHGWIDPWGQSG